LSIRTLKEYTHALGDVHPTLLGKAYIVVQALTVLILADLQYFAVRRSRSDRLISAE
jgi:hypothetical protein